MRWPSQRIASPIAACCNRHRSAVACLEDTLCGISRRLYKSLCEVIEISVCRLRTAVRRLWMAIQSLCMCIQSLQTEILVSFAEDFCMLYGRFQHASRAISVSFTDGFGRFRGRIQYASRTYSVSFVVGISMFREWFHQSASGTALRFGRRFAPMCRGGLCVKHVDDEASENSLLCDEGLWEMR